MFARALYSVCKFVSWLMFVTVFRARAMHASRVPREGALILAANHQSYLDPPLVGGFIARPATYIARAGLFSWGPFGAFLRALNCVPIKGGAGDSAAIKETLRRLDEGHAVVIFPEGARSTDGAMQEYKRGVALLVKRSKCPVVPVAVEGVWDAWARGGRPRLFTPVAVMYGEAIGHDELMQGGAEAGLLRLARETERMRMELRKAIRERTGGKHPRAGAGDVAREFVGSSPTNQGGG